MRKSPVGFRHLMGIFSLFDCGALIIGRIYKLSRQFLRHGFTRAAPGAADQPERRGDRVHPRRPAQAAGDP